MKKEKVIVAKVPKPRKFDLSFSKTAENIKILAALEDLKTSGGWLFLTQVFQENINYLGKCIISKRDPESGKDLTEAEVDVLRFKYDYLTELLDKPDQFIKRLSREEVEQEDLDPYDKGRQPRE